MTKQAYSIVGTNFCGPKAQVLIKALKTGTDVVLVRDPDNKFDKNAVAVYVDGERIGYVPKNKNAVLAQFIDQSGRDFGVVNMASDQLVGVVQRKAIDGKFTLSPNSAFPQVQVGD